MVGNVVVVAYLNILSQNLPEGTEENHKKFNRVSECPLTNSKRAPPENKSEVLEPKSICWAYEVNSRVNAVA
jgi:hypothetical protein